MKRLTRFAVLLVAALAVIQFLPLYVERTMMRSWRVDHAGDVIEWGWKLCTLRDYWSDYRYMSPEQRPALWLAVNIALAFAYAPAAAFTAERILARLKRRGGRVG
jgi:hypothetical protein